MIEKKTVSLYIANLIGALKKQMFQLDSNAQYLIFAEDVIRCVENIASIIQKEPCTESSSKPEAISDNIHKSIETLNNRVQELEDQVCSLIEKKEITDTERLDFIEKHGFSFDPTIPCKSLRQAIDAAMRGMDGE